MVNILGVSAFYHDSSACLVRDGEIIAAAQEERFSRIKHDNSYPTQSIDYCLSEAGNPKVDAIVFYENPKLKHDRVLKTFQSYPQNLKNFKKALKSQEKKINLTDGMEYVDHHISHAASAFYPSPFRSAAIVTIDGVGEWDTTTISIGMDNKIEKISSIEFPNSIGMLYSAFTYFCGFKVNNGEYKLMGLAPYGRPVYAQKILDNMIDLKEDGSYALNLDYFGYHNSERIISDKFCELFKLPKRQNESKLTEEYCNIAASIQAVTELIVLKICSHARNITGQDNLCLAGGVALNCVANGKIENSGLFKNIWIQPAAGDAGGSLGAALHYYYSKGNPRKISKNDSMKSSYLGPSYDEEIVTFLKENSIEYEKLSIKTIAEHLSNEKVVGWYQGRMEFGPRALGNRSILGDARSEKMQSIMNLKIKFRESFRPFAPIVLKEDCRKYFELNSESPYMLMVSKVKDSKRKNLKKSSSFDVMDVLKNGGYRSTLPAVTHVDNSARIQTIDEKNGKIHELLSEFKKITGTGVLINTSFNVRGEPIVCTPEDAYDCFVNSGMDYLVMGDYIVGK